MTTKPHETWMDESQGKAHTYRGNRTIVDAFREEYTARSSWEQREITEATLKAAEPITQRALQETLMERQSEAIDYPN